MIFLHQLLGKNLARLYLSSSLSRTKNRNAPDDEVVNNALSQRRLRPNNGEVNLEVSGCLEQCLNIGGTYIQVLSNLSRAGVARSDINLFDLAALG
jgi:hypothetical protein